MERFHCHGFAGRHAGSIARLFLAFPWRIWPLYLTTFLGWENDGKGEDGRAARRRSELPGGGWLILALSANDDSGGAGLITAVET